MILETTGVFDTQIQRSNGGMLHTNSEMPHGVLTTSHRGSVTHEARNARGSVAQGLRDDRCSVTHNIRDATESFTYEVRDTMRKYYA